MHKRTTLPHETYRIDFIQSAMLKHAQRHVLVALMGNRKELFIVLATVKRYSYQSEWK